jgi:ClpP class serine protease
MTEEAFIQHAVLIDRLLANPAIIIPAYGDIAKAQLSDLASSGNVNLTCEYYNPDIPDSVAFYAALGAIHYDSWWNFSTKYFVANFRAAEVNPKIVAHLLYINSGGGMAYYCDKVAETLQAATKPVVVMCEEKVCSAAYYIACHATKIFATTQFDIIGSIGCKVAYRNLDAYFEKIGLKLISAYATKSTHKDKLTQELEDGKPANYVQNILDPLLAEFERHVRAGRPAAAAAPEDAHVFNGETYFAPQAQQYGLIDGICSFEDALQEAYSLGKAQQNTQKFIYKQFNT